MIFFPIVNIASGLSIKVNETYRLSCYTFRSKRQFLNNTRRLQDLFAAFS